MTTKSTLFPSAGTCKTPSCGSTEIKPSLHSLPSPNMPRPPKALVVGAGSNVIDLFFPLRRWPQQGEKQYFADEQVMREGPPPLPLEPPGLSMTPSIPNSSAQDGSSGESP